MSERASRPTEAKKHKDIGMAMSLDAMQVSKNNGGKKPLFFYGEKRRIRVLIACGRRSTTVSSTSPSLN